MLTPIIYQIPLLMPSIVHTVIPPRRRSSFKTGNSLFFIISLPFFVNSVHKAPNTVRNPFNDVGKNGIPWPILTPFQYAGNGFNICIVQLA